MKGRAKRIEHFPIPFLAAEQREPSPRPGRGDNSLRNSAIKELYYSILFPRL